AAAAPRLVRAPPGPPAGPGRRAPRAARPAAPRGGGRGPAEPSTGGGTRPTSARGSSEKLRPSPAICQCTLQVADSRGAAIVTLATACGTEIADEGTVRELSRSHVAADGDR